MEGPFSVPPPSTTHPHVHDLSRDQILSRFRGQTVRIPDLGKMMKGWPEEVNPHKEAMEFQILQIIENHTINDSVRMRLTKAQLSQLISGWYPWASKERLEALTSFQAWMFIVDDTVDHYSIVSRFNAGGLRKILDESLDFVERSLGLRGGPTPDYTEADAVTSFAEVARALSDSCSLAYRRRIAVETQRTLNAYLQEAENRFWGRVPSLSEYVDYRGASSCIMQVAMMFEFANGMELPNEVMQSPEMQELYRSAIAVMWIVNDIVSLRKEIHEGFVENIVVLLLSGSEGNLQSGIDGAVAMLEQEVLALREASEVAMRRYAHSPYQEQVALLAKNCQSMNLCNWRWSMKTPRYCLFDIEPDSEGGFSFVIDQVTRH
ncbi:terpene synthase family protein [Mycena capillaripes]|nr:terpene synthase family protein [Mycena capillaripes]